MDILKLVVCIFLKFYIIIGKGGKLGKAIK